MIALQILNDLADQRKAERSPNFPAKYIPRSRYNDRDANGLTRSVVDWFTLNGHFATRLQSTGTYRADIGKHVASQQRAGMSDVFAIVQGRAVHVEIKIGKDRLSDVQKETITALQSAGALCTIVQSFQQFYDWYMSGLATLDEEFNEADALPFGPPPPPDDDRKSMSKDVTDEVRRVGGKITGIETRSDGILIAASLGKAPCLLLLSHVYNSHWPPSVPFYQVHSIPKLRAYLQSL